MAKFKRARIKDLCPTQLTVGLIEVEVKRKRLKALSPKAREAFLEAHPMPVVIGPEGKLYITDHHHLARAALEAKVDLACFVVEADFSSRRPDKFWHEMDKKLWVHPLDQHGIRHRYNHIPASLDKLVDDVYRSLAGFVRDAGGFEKPVRPSWNSSGPIISGAISRSRISKPISRRPFATPNGWHAARGPGESPATKDERRASGSDLDAMTADSGATVSAIFEAAAERFPEREFLHIPAEACRDYAPGAIGLSYGEARARIASIGAAIGAAGYRAGHRIGIALDNRPDFFLHFLALNALGISVVPLNAAMSLKELSFVLAHSDAALAITHAGHTAHVGGCLPADVQIHVVDAQRAFVPPPVRKPSAAPGEAALLYTSGTTGTPKGCVLANDYFLLAGLHYAGLGGYCRFDGVNDRLATPLPVTHMNALTVSFMAVLTTGGCLIQLDRFHPTSWWRSLAASRATAFHYLGVMPAMLLKAPPSEQDNVAGVLRFGFGAGVDPRHHAAFEARFGVPLIEAWAMTETGGGAWITANHEPRHVGHRCFGKAPSGLECRLVADGGEELGAGAVGELQVRRAGADRRRGFFAGYYNDQHATDQAWAGGWFHTGDLVRIDAEGSFFFVDRSKNVVRRSGENIAAVEVESALQTHPDVSGCAVCPVSDELRGEEVFAFVVLRPGAAPGAETAVELQNHCRRSLVYFKAPGYVAFRADLPQTASQKLARAEIKALAAAAVGSALAFDLRHLKKRQALGETRTK